MLFFSSLGFKVLESGDFGDFPAPRGQAQARRTSWFSLLLLPFGYIVFIGAALFVGTFGDSPTW